MLLNLKRDARGSSLGNDGDLLLAVHEAILLGEVVENQHVFAERRSLDGFTVRQGVIVVHLESVAGGCRKTGGGNQPQQHAPGSRPG